LGRLPLAIGMPVLVANNFDVEGGVVNGSRGTVASLRYTENGQKERTLRSCTVHIPGATGEVMPGLGDREMPVLADTSTFKIAH
ncbi:hypothetical protein FPV67DRAFT_1386179, partial [Lyophyllum atratum]